MKKILLATALIGASIVSASAADMGARTYTKAPMYAAPIYNWTGIYVGAHVGGAFGTDGGLGVAGFTNGNNDAAFLGGGQIGADYQFSPNWLVGIEGQISGLSNNNRSFTSAAGSVTDKTDWLASVTGRLGYTWGPGLIYAKGGVAFRDNNGLSAFGPTGIPVAFTTNRDETGYTVGGGFEYMFAPSWSGKIEYQYYNFDKTNVVAAGAGLAAPLGGTYTSDLHTVKAGINYHFNWGGPAGGKY